MYPFCVFGGDFTIKNKYGDIKTWIPIKSIKDDAICLKNGRKVKLFKIEPINFELKSEREQINILEMYKLFLKSYSSDLQIIIQTDRVDLEDHIKSIENFKKEKLELSEMADDYIKMVMKISQKRESISRKFYLITNGKNEKALKQIEQCGNILIECNQDEIVSILNRYFSKYSILRKETKWV